MDPTDSLGPAITLDPTDTLSPMNQLDPTSRFNLLDLTGSLNITANGLIERIGPNRFTGPNGYIDLLGPTDPKKSKESMNTFAPTEKLPPADRSGRSFCNIFSTNFQGLVV